MPELAEPQKKSRTRVFPMHLTGLENYLFIDDRPNYPMTFIVVFDFSGNLHRDEFQESIDFALSRHSLLQAIIQPAKQNRDCWVDARGLKPHVSWDDLDAPLEFPDSEFINLREEIGLRIWVRKNDSRATVTFQFHHSVCDGIGAYQFVGDLLWKYSNLTGDDLLEDLPEIDPAALRSRGRTAYPIENFTDENGKFKIEKTLTRRMIWGQTTSLKNQRAKSNSQPNPFPGIKSISIDPPEYREIRLGAQAMGLTPNDYLVEALFVTLKQWNIQNRKLQWPQSLAVMIPLDLRDPPTQYPAANFVTYSFVRRKCRDLNDRESFANSIREELLTLKSNRHRSNFMNMIVGAHFHPKALNRILKRQRCLATATLSNTGDPTKQFYVPLPREKGAVRCGNLLLEDISGVPPLRPKTHATLSIFTYRRALKVCVRCDPNSFSIEDTQRFLEMYVNTIREGVKNVER